MKRFTLKHAMDMAVGCPDWRPAPFAGKDPLRMAWRVYTRIEGEHHKQQTYFGKPSEKQLQRFMQAAQMPLVFNAELVFIDRKTAIFHGYQGTRWVPAMRRFATRPTAASPKSFYFPGVIDFNPAEMKFFRKRIKGKHWYYAQAKKLPLANIEHYKTELKLRGLL